MIQKYFLSLHTGWTQSLYATLSSLDKDIDIKSSSTEHISFMLSHNIRSLVRVVATQTWSMSGTCPDRALMLLLDWRLLLVPATKEQSTRQKVLVTMGLQAIGVDQVGVWSLVILACSLAGELCRLGDVTLGARVET